jgi:chitinase
VGRAVRGSLTMGRRLICSAVLLVIAGGLSGCGLGGGGSAGIGGSRVRAPGGDFAFSPYVDVTLTTPFDLEGVAPDAGARSLTLAFVTSGGGCEPKWGGDLAIGDPAVLVPARRVRAAGVALRVSFGGAAGSELAETCSSTSALETAYASVLNRYQASGADFDLEGQTLADHAAMARRGAAIAALERRLGRPVSVSLTLPATPDGLSEDGLDALRTIRAAGARVNVVNLLAMDYGTPQAPGRMGRDAVLAAEAGHRQLARLRSGFAGWNSLGLTVMAGVNDSDGEVLTLTEAERVAQFASGHGLGLSSIWSLARDNPCEGSLTVAQPTCSGVHEPPYAFSRAFGANSAVGLLPRRAVDTS